MNFYLSELEQWVEYSMKGNQNKSDERKPLPKAPEPCEDDFKIVDALTNTIQALSRLPISCCLPTAALLNLFAGFSMDLGFSSSWERKKSRLPNSPKPDEERTPLMNSSILSHNCKHYSSSRQTWDLSTFPIHDGCCLELYGYRVAGTVAEMVLSLVFHHYEKSDHKPSAAWRSVICAGARMGIALQYVNIARDVARDASDGRVYLPTVWLEELGISNGEILKNPYLEEARILRLRLLNMADKIYTENFGAIDEIPQALGWNETSYNLEMTRVRHGMRAAVENYMEIGRMVRRELESGKYNIASVDRRRFKLKATVPKWRRIWVIAKVLFSR